MVLGPNYPNNDPTGGTARTSNRTGTSHGTVTASGFDVPVNGTTFANGVSAFGSAEANSNNQVVVTIFNDGSVAETVTWNGTIFAGGLGVVEPSFDCNFNMLETCDSFYSPPAIHGASAEVVFGAKLDGASLFDGRLFVDDSEKTQALSGIELQNLRIAQEADGTIVNEQYFWWDETEFQIDLGVFQPGETKTLEFFVMTSAISSANDGCGLVEGEVFICIGAQAGFGDPDSNGGNQLSTGISYRSLSFSSSAEPMAISSAPEAPVPLPAGVWLFGSFLAGGFGLGKLRRARRS